MTVVIVCAFDPVAELDGVSGVLAVDSVVAHRLADAHLVEIVERFALLQMRYVPGSAEFRAAAQALRDAREDDATNTPATATHYPRRRR